MATDPKPAADALAEPFRRIGEPHAGHDADLIDLDDENTLWLVEGGAVDVFVVEVEQGLVAAPLKHLLRVESGELLFGVEPAAGGGLHLKAKRTPGASLHRASRGPWLEGVAELVARRVDVWVEKLSHAIARDVPHDGRPGQLLRPGESAQIAAGTILSSRRGVVWVSAPGQVLFLDAQQQSAEDVPGLTPVSTATRLTVLDEGRVEGRSAGALMREGRLFAALAEFHRLVLETERLSRVLATVDTANQQTERAALRRREAERARAELARVADPAAAGRAGTHPDSALMAALDAVGAHEGIEFRRPGRSRGEPERPHSLQDVLVASAVRARRVRLSPEDRWWRSDSGALLGFRAGDGQAVALLPGRLGRYRMVAPDGASTRLNAERAAALAPGAWSFVAPLPQRTAARDVARVMARNMAPEVMRFLAGGLLAGMLSLAPAFVIRALFDRILPSHDTGLLLGAATVLVLLAFTGLLLTLFQSTALLRAEGRTTARATAAVWDRLIGSRTGDLRGFAAGDLGQRALVFQTLREQAAGVAAHTLLSIVFLAPTFALLFVFNAAIGWASLVSGTVGLGIVAAFGVAQIGPQRRMLVAQQSLSGSLLDFLGGIVKVRTTGAEEAAFARWAHRYGGQKRAETDVRKLNEWVIALTASLPIFTSALFFAVAVSHGGALGTEDFAAAYAAAMVFFASVLRLGTAIETIAAAVPACQQVAPILDASPEGADGVASPELRGELRFDHVSFRDPETDATVLDDVSIHARPGELVAIVGESGAGKSTLLRLALALEEPTSGSVYYDTHDMAHINRRALRRQIGVVSQNAALQQGTVLHNIIGVATDLTVDDAWRAARLAALDDDIRRMPMGMYTVCGGGSPFFSGGQIQRMHIAAALVRNPRILMLDEATNWLDTRTQARIMAAIADLAMTRLVIAHRLSTIRDADRIYVLDSGAVVQTGTFEELANAPGVFRRLVRRQRL